MKRAIYAVLVLLGIRWCTKIMLDDEYAEKWARRLRM